MNVLLKEISMCNVKMQLDLPTSVNGRVILPFCEGFIDSELTL